MDKYLQMEERHRQDMKRLDISIEIPVLPLYRSVPFRQAEKHKQDVQVWETKYDILKKRYFPDDFLYLSSHLSSSMMVLRDEMYTRQTHVRDRFTVKPAVVTYN